MSDLDILSPTATTAGLVTVLGTIVLKLVEKFLSVQTASSDEEVPSLLEEHSALRKELRDELDTVKEELIALRHEVDEWREKYYHQVEMTNTLSIEVNILKSRLRKYEDTTGEFGIWKDTNDD